MGRNLGAQPMSIPSMTTVLAWPGLCTAQTALGRPIALRPHSPGPARRAAQLLRERVGLLLWHGRWRAEAAQPVTRCPLMACLTLSAPAWQQDGLDSHRKKGAASGRQLTGGMTARRCSALGEAASAAREAAPGYSGAP
jgi:hypothetical protein